MPMCHIWPIVQLCQIVHSSRRAAELAIGYWLLAMRAALAPLRQSSYYGADYRAGTRVFYPFDGSWQIGLKRMRKIRQRQGLQPNPPWSRQSR